MAKMNFGGVEENVIIREEFPLEKAREVLKDETIAVIGYGVQGPGQSMNLRDNGFNVIVGQRAGKTYDKAVADGWVPGETLFSIEEACKRGTMACNQVASYSRKGSLFLSRLRYHMERPHRRGTPEGCRRDTCGSQRIRYITPHNVP